MRLSKAIGILGRHVTGNGYSKLRGLIFVIGHMRSYSTLLSHQIGSSPDVAGYFEAHQRYRNQLDLIELAEKVVRAGGHAPDGRFLFDKLLHPLEIRDTVLQRQDLKVILMVREPQATIRSILRIRAGGIGTVDEAAEYYLQRLQQIREILDRRRGRVLFLEAEALIEDSTAALSGITKYLGLTVPLTEAYERFPMTGKSKFGDPSAWIMQGTTVRRRGGNVALGETSGHRFATACEAYEKFRCYAHAAAESAILCPSSYSVPTWTREVITRWKRDRLAMLASDFLATQ